VDFAAALKSRWDEMKAAEDPRLTQVSTICLALPEASRTVHGSHAAFTVRKKTFAYFLNDHHGMASFPSASAPFPGENKGLRRRASAEVLLPAYIGPRGWSGCGWIAAGSTGRKYGTLRRPAICKPPRRSWQLRSRRASPKP